MFYFWRVTVLFSTIGAPFYLCLINGWGLQFAYIFANTCYIPSSHVLITLTLVGLKCCFTMVLICISLMSNILEHIFINYWLFVYLLWKKCLFSDLSSFYWWALGCVLSSCSRVWLFLTLWTVAHQAPLSMGFPRQEYWSGLPCPSPGDLPSPGMNPYLLCLIHWRQILYPLSNQGSYILVINSYQIHYLQTFSLILQSFFSLSC